MVKILSFFIFQKYPYFCFNEKKSCKMLKFKIVLLFFLIFQGVTFVYSQKLKYKELYPILKSDTVTFTFAKQLLSDYIKEEPDFPNAYYQYALLCEKHIKELDVLTETNLVIKYCDQAVTNYTLFLNTTNEKDLKNNKEYYSEFVKSNPNSKPEINYSEVTQAIKQNIIEIQDFSSKIKHMSSLFYKSIDFYESAKKNFLEINNQYLCENDIYLLADESLIKNCNQLIVCYDSAVFYISAYSKSIKEFPISKYNQQFVFKKIETYRLDGFDSETSFLINNITIWDYGFWAKKTINTIQTEIKDLRIKLDKTEKELCDAIKILRDTSQLFSIPNEYRFNKTTLLKLKKYDFNSSVLNLFLFQKYQIDWLILMRNKEKYDSLSFSSAEDKIIFYGKLLKSLYACDSLIKDLNFSASEKNLQKYKVFISSFFGSKEGFYNYIETNDKEIKKYLIEYQNKSTYVFLSFFNDTTNFINYKNEKIPLFISGQNNLSFLYNTTAIKNDSSGNIYLSGYYKKNAADSLNIAFILRSNKNKVVWFKSFENVASNTYSYCLDVKNKEIISIISEINKVDSSLSNTLVKLDLNGKEKVNKNIPFNNPINCFASDSSGNNHLVVLKIGNNSENISLSYINDEGNPIWQNIYPMKGNIYEVLYIGNSFLIFGNYSSIDINNHIYYGVEPNSDKTSVFVLSSDKTGKKIKFLPFKSKETIKVLRIRFYDAGNIHIWTKKTPKELPSKTSDFIQVIVNSSLQVLYSNED